MKKFWGYHLMVDCANCDRVQITNLDVIKEFISALIKACKMKVLGEMLIENLQTGDKNLFGYSVAQLIHTSSITCHFMDLSGDIYVDVFSCKPFNPEKVTTLITKFFMPEKMNKHFIIRDAGL
jgi:S-adenosylmethionine/arginine decarboxylase-like enzyme